MITLKNRKEVGIMDFQLSEDIKFLKQSIRDFVDSEVDPLAMEIEEKDEIPEKL